MANQDWERFGEEIRRTVQNAIDSKDYEKLNQTITNTVNSAVDSAARGFRNMGDVIDRTSRTGWGRRTDGGRYGQFGGQNAGQGPQFGRGAQFGQGPQGNPWQNPFPGNAGQVNRPAAYKKQSSPYFKSTSAKKASAIALMACGFSIGGIFAVIFAVSFLGRVILGGSLYATLVLGVLTGIFLMVGGMGTAMLGRIRRFRSYIQEMQGREYGEIKTLAMRINKPAKYVAKDLGKMIRRGWFKQGHLDKQKTCLMVSHGAYEQYMNLMNQTARQRQEEEERKDQETKKQQEPDGLSPEVRAIIREGDAYIRKIHQCNDAIPGEEISAKISRMETLVDKIFDRVEQNPETVTDIRRLMEYYLPTTVKLLEAYEDLDAQPVQGENIISSKREIEKTLDTLNTAFEKLLDSLFQDTAWDVSSDISVLKTMLAQEGLTEDGLTGKKGGTKGSTQ